MLAASAAIWASGCGVLRALRGDFLSLSSDTKSSAPETGVAETFISVVSLSAMSLADTRISSLAALLFFAMALVVMVVLLMGLGRSAALRPCPSARPG